MHSLIPYSSVNWSSLFQTFQTVKDDEKFAVENCRYELIGEDRYADAVRHMVEQHFPDEILMNSLGVTFSGQLRELYLMKTLRQNMSIALIAKDTDQIIGFRGIRICDKKPSFTLEDMESDALKKAIGLYNYMRTKADAYKYYDVDELFEMYGLSVHRDYRRKGIGFKMMQIALQFISNMNLGPLVIKGTCDSNFSQRIYEKLNFETLCEVIYADYKDNGEVLIINTGEHKSVKVYGKII